MQAILNFAEDFALQNDSSETESAGDSYDGNPNSLGYAEDDFAGSAGHGLEELEGYHGESGWQSSRSGRRGGGYRARAPIGSRVQILWPVDNSWYTATVQGYKGAVAVVKYEDGETEELDLTKEKMRTLDSRGTTAGASSGQMRGW